MTQRNFSTNSVVVSSVSSVADLVTAPVWISAMTTWLLTRPLIHDQYVGSPGAIGRLRDIAARPGRGEATGPPVGGIPAGAPQYAELF